MPSLSRRSFVAWLSAAIPASRGLRVPEFLRRRADLDVPLARALAAAILPTELGGDGVRRAADAFIAWAKGYRAGAELSHGYGSARIRNAGTDPSIRWALQLHALDDHARKTLNRSFATLTGDERRSIVREQLADERATALGNVASAQHVVVAMLAHFYDSAEATDLCYESRIGKLSCRPLAQSPVKPVQLRRAGS
jgi:hypothetical protein